MNNIILLIANTVYYYISIMMVLMMVRMFMSLVIAETPSKFELFIFSTTEPLVYPVRMFLMKFEAFQSIPIDFSLFITTILLSTVSFFIL